MARHRDKRFPLELATDSPTWTRAHQARNMTVQLDGSFQANTATRAVDSEMDKTSQVFLKKTAQVCERDEKMSLRKLAILANVDDAFTSDSHKSLKGLADGHQRFHLRHPAIINSSN